jgi:hypothetical protein
MTFSRASARSFEGDFLGLDLGGETVEWVLIKMNTRAIAIIGNAAGMAVLTSGLKRFSEVMSIDLIHQ